MVLFATFPDTDHNINNYQPHLLKICIWKTNTIINCL